MRRSKYLRQADPTLAELTEDVQPVNDSCINGFNGYPPDKLNGQLKNHLDSIFSGFQKLISGADDDLVVKKLPFVIQKTIHNILFIKTHMQRQDEFDAVSFIDKYLEGNDSAKWQDCAILFRVRLLELQYLQK